MTLTGDYNLVRSRRGTAGLGVFLIACTVLLGMLCLPVYADTVVQWESDIPSDIANNLKPVLANTDTYTSCDEVTALNLKQQRARLGKVMLDSFHAFGYFASRFSALTLLKDVDCQTWSASVELGEPATIANITLNVTALPLSNKNPKQAPTIESDAMALALREQIEAFKALQGQRFSQSQYNNFKNTFYSTAIALGYFDIEQQSASVIVSADGLSVNIEINYALNARYHFGELTLNQASILPSLLQSFTSIEPGQPYQLNQLNVLRNELRQTGYFESVTVRPDLNARKNGHIPIVVSVKEKKRHYVEYGLGVSTDIGPRASVSWKRPRINNRGHSIATALSISAPEQQITIDYKIPVSDPNNDYYTLQIGAEHSDLNSVKSSSVLLGATRYFEPWQKQWRPNIFTRYEYSNFETPGESPRSTILLLAGGALERLRSDDPMFATRGDKQSLRMETAQDALLSDFSLYRINFTSRWLRPLSEQFSWLGVWQGQWLESDDFANTPTNLRAFAGGDQSVRGFAFESVGPQNSEGQFIGGTKAISTQQELFWMIDDTWAVATFVDYARVDGQQDSIDAKSAGLGGHWRSPVGPIRFYIARGSSEIENTWRFHLLLGPLL